MRNQTKRKTLRRQRFLLKLLCTVLAVILIAMVGGTLWAQHLLSQINHTQTHAENLTPGDVLEQLLPNQSGEKPGMNPVSSRDTIHILLIGQDRRPGEERARSDAMILCSFHKKAKQLTMTSILRDLYVKIPGYQDNRINAAYAYGGMELLHKTLEENFGIQVDGTIEVDFGQFSHIVDQLGGVTIDLRADEARLINEKTKGNLTEGSCRLNGEQALTYSRIRSLDADGDFSRTSRQRKVISAMAESCKTADLKTLLRLLDEILPMITTDMSNLKIIGYGLELFPKLADITVVSQRIPADGTYQGQMIRGMSVLVADMEQARRMLEDTFQEKE